MLTTLCDAELAGVVEAVVNVDVEECGIGVGCDSCGEEVRILKNG